MDQAHIHSQVLKTTLRESLVEYGPTMERLEAKRVEQDNSRAIIPHPWFNRRSGKTEAMFPTYEHILRTVPEIKRILFSSTTGSGYWYLDENGKLCVKWKTVIRSFPSGPPDHRPSWGRWMNKQSNQIMWLDETGAHWLSD